MNIVFNKKDIDYLIYYSSDQKIIIKEGVRKHSYTKDNSSTFQPVKLNSRNEYVADGGYLTSCPVKYNEICNGKIIVRNMDEVPDAIYKIKKSTRR